MKARFFLFVLVSSLFFLLAACSSNEEMVDATLDSPAVTRADDSLVTPTSDPLQAIKEDTPLAVISTRSLRVRDEPSDDAKVTFAVKERQIFPVLAISANGKYLELEIPDAPGGRGWVDANFVTMQGDITNIERGVVPSTPTPISLPSPTAVIEIPEDAPRATVKTDGQRLRVRKAPDADAAIAGRVNDGDTVVILETSEDGKWAKIAGDAKSNPDGGWVAMEFLELE